MRLTDLFRRRTTTTTTTTTTTPTTTSTTTPSSTAQQQQVTGGTRVVLHDDVRFDGGAGGRTGGGASASTKSDPVRVLYARYPGLDGPLPHAGLAALFPWDLMKLDRAGPEVGAAFKKYYEPGFIHMDPPAKASLLATLVPCMKPDDAATLLKFHLPRTVAGTDKVITTALESETRSLPMLFRFYAPDPSGKLDARAITPELRAELLALPRNNITQRFPDDVFLKSLRWRDLPPATQYAYLRSVQVTIDPRVTLHRITDPKVTKDGNIAPSTLQETLKWERGLHLAIGELITKTSYASADQRIADRSWISAQLGDTQGFHMHGVAELTSPEEKARIGPKLVAFAALQDLLIFGRAAQVCHENYTHPFLEVWQAGSAAEVASSFVGKDGKGQIDPDAIDVHKFHFVGIRTRIYGNPDRVGVEIRGRPGSTPQDFDRAGERFVSLLATGNIEKLPSPPWPGWDAGEKGVAKKHEEWIRGLYQREGGEYAAFDKRAQVSFDDLFDMCAAGAGTKNGFAFQGPLWSYEAIPGLTDDEKQRIASARTTFCGEMMSYSVGLSELIEAGRDTKEVEQQMLTWVSTSAMEFFKNARVDLAIDRVLNEAAGMTPGMPAP